MDTDSYCRDIETYLCRRNEGHLLRVVGPAFEMVAGWAASGIPIKVAFQGIDRAVERRLRKPPSRRPLRIEFCEADVLDAFDEWRRAVGIGTAAGGVGSAGDESVPTTPSQKRGHSLRAHVDRVVTRLTDRLAGGSLPAALERVIEALAARLSDMRASSRALRGEARTSLVSELRRLDGEMMAAAVASTPPETLDALRRESEQELSGFRGRMPEDAYARALSSATGRLLRERLKLPEIAYGQE